MCAQWHNDGDDPTRSILPRHQTHPDPSLSTNLAPCRPQPQDDDEDAEDTQQETGDDEEERESGVKLKREGEMSPGDMKNDTNGNIVQDAGTVTVTTAIAPAGTVPPGSSPPLPDGLLAQVTFCRGWELDCYTPTTAGTAWFI